MQRRFSLLLLLLTLAAGTMIPAPLPLAAQTCSDEAKIVDYSLDPASTTIAPNSTFTASWTVRNSGDCAWSRSYRVNFVGGDRLQGPRTLRLNGSVDPGETLVVTVELTAPSALMSYSGRWQLRNPDGDTFGPELTFAIEVREDELATTDVVLPEILIFAEGGGGGGNSPLSGCISEGAMPESPKMMIHRTSPEDRSLWLYLCGLQEGTKAVVEMRDPLGNIFRRSYVQGALISYTENDRQYTGTVMEVYFHWLDEAPSGEWTVSVISEELNTDAIIEIAEPEEVWTFIDPFLDNVPTGPVDPFRAEETCHYGYAPGEEMLVRGKNLPPNTTLEVGIYHERLGFESIDHLTVRSDSAGNISLPYYAPLEPEQYRFVIFQNVNPEAFAEDGITYHSGGEDYLAYSCFTVVLDEAPQFPLRMAFIKEDLGASDIFVQDFSTGRLKNLSLNLGDCSSLEPAWWPDGEWVLYQSNCIREGEFGPLREGEDFDLYASLVNPPLWTSSEEANVRLTATPDVDETEADVNSDGLIVYRRSDVGAPLSESGELWLLDIFEDTNTPLGLTGKSPTWSPDDTRIAFMSDIEGSWQIYVYDFEMDEVWLASKGCVTHCRYPAWSPDGTQLLYQRSVSLRDFDVAGLWIALVEGDSTPKLFLEGNYARPTWSSEGWIAFNGVDGIYRAMPGIPPIVERYFYDPDQSYYAPVWSH